MLQAFVFDETAIIVRHWFEIGPDADEHGARVEIRRRVRHPHRGSESAPQILELDGLVWRADLFDLVGAEPGNFSCAHHHLNFEGIEPIDRSWDEELSADPLAWTEARLRDYGSILAARGVVLDDAEAEQRDVLHVLPSIMRAVAEAAGARCLSRRDCLQATRDTTEIVMMMASLFRSDAPGGPRDPRLAAAD
ncbi:hypothetical protein ACFY4C_02715 [Actinomadura viridis]|uniref:hypothetical protein n=1 Tax=Actinomadura viridis TaxID=58110 RepID=UPI0036C7EFF4